MSIPRLLCKRAAILINEGTMPPAVWAVRIEEMINYFRFDYPQPSSRRAVFRDRYRAVGVSMESPTIASRCNWLFGALGRSQSSSQPGLVISRSCARNVFEILWTPPLEPPPPRRPMRIRSRVDTLERRRPHRDRRVRRSQRPGCCPVDTRRSEGSDSPRPSPGSKLGGSTNGGGRYPRSLIESPG